MKNAEHKHHILPLWIYLAVASTLLVFTGLTIAAAHINFTELTGISGLNFVVAMIIATIKATLVALFFMHLLYDNKLYLFSLCAAVACLLIFISITMTDTQYRGDVNAIESRPIVDQITQDKFIQRSGEHEKENTIHH